ncbi:hypothetical protein PC9H_008633 [Pleurotus ostreatus]|uniref:DNA primase n=1 Tax=Pleurotus ostreatus TaxID=5322 RepID=A0A8H6ZW59_PLEOS|nr:uncharacterized protein PC9H_008633 [Pleurotus ostreatus]KAF7426265.1 hypothetical protein PC9H_008633 [Pleurotus ostreatus]
MDATAMPTFYRRIYPYKSIFLWLNHEHNPTKLFTHREFAFTLPGDVYLRYQSFANAEEFKKQLCSMTPTRFEIGPVYSGRPRDRKTLRPSAFVPVQRELVFDIDMTDYDNIRTCCSGAAICKRCWGFIAAAVKVLDKAIRDQFGYQHLLWVYSGRRGIHLWISDQEAVDLTDDQRKAIVNYLTVVATSKEASKHLNVRSNGALPSLLSNALLDLGTIFDSLILKDQDLFAGEQAWLALLELLPQSMRGTLEAKWSSGEKNSSAKWDDVKGVINGLKSQSPAAFNTALAAMEDIVISYTYPRLDAEVSKHRNHLLKAPFCVHPGTGRVCVPVDPSEVDMFDPAAVPTIGQLLQELDTIREGSSELPQEHHNDWEKTSLKPYVDMLDKHCLRLVEEARHARRGAPGKYLTVLFGRPY